MILISHRGNISGRFENWENEPTYISSAISKGYIVEIDVWYKNRMFWLGHDKPDYGINQSLLDGWGENIWIHAKNLEAFKRLSEQRYHVFYHTIEPVVITSRGHSWYYTGLDSSGGICVLPELHDFNVPTGSTGICSDYIEKFKK